MHAAAKPVTPDDLLNRCVTRFGQRDVDQLPVVDEDGRLRVRYGINVYAVRHTDGQTTMPSADEQLRQGETLLVVGPAAEVEHVREHVTQPSTDTPDDKT